VVLDDQQRTCDHQPCHGQQDEERSPARGDQTGADERGGDGPRTPQGPGRADTGRPDANRVKLRGKRIQHGLQAGHESAVEEQLRHEQALTPVNRRLRDEQPSAGYSRAECHDQQRVLGAEAPHGPSADDGDQDGAEIVDRDAEAGP
jgi:hypothetical protein